MQYLTDTDLAGERGCVLSGLKEGNHPDKCLGQGVMDLSGQAVALPKDGGLPLG